MNNKSDKPGVTRREFFNALAKRAVAEVKEGYHEGLSAHTAAAAAKQNRNTPP